MKKRLHDKKAGIAILISLIVISLAEIIFRAVAMGLEASSTANFGEQLVVIALAVAILILTAKGKDKASYICYGVWIGYFVLDQLFELPSMIMTTLSLMERNAWVLNFGDVSIVANVVAMACIVAIGVLLLEYMNDGTIYNRAFNILCILTTVLLVVSIVPPITGVIGGATTKLLLGMFDSAKRLTMVFLCTFFAYDSAKAQLKKTNLTK